MGRHEAYRPTLTSRIAKPVKLVFKYTGISAMASKFPVRRTWGFALTAALTLVTCIDPYFGTLGSYAAEVEYVNYFDEAKAAEPVKVELARGGYEVVSGQAASKVFVELAVVPSANTVQAIAFKKMNGYGWGMEQYSCLVKLWNRESNWRVNAYNASSGAYGIPQALPGKKMAVAGADWMTNPETQINWGLGYIGGRYGNPCGALSHSNQYNWY